MRTFTNRALFNCSFVIAVALLPSALLADFKITPRPDLSIDLPPELNEASGLYLDSEGIAYTHNDETGIIFTIDLEKGITRPCHIIGVPTIAGDFEGLVGTDDSFFLVSSDGYLVEIEKGPCKTHKQYTIYDTGMRSVCEIEGIEHEASGGFLLLCKRAKQKKKRSRILIYRWRRSTRFQSPEVFIDTKLGSPWKEFSNKHFSPSGLSSAADGRLLVIDSAGRGIVTLAKDGEVEAVAQMPAQFHPQQEGLAVTADGDLFIVDEGGKGPGVLSVYRSAYKPSN